MSVTAPVRHESLGAVETRLLVTQKAEIDRRYRALGFLSHDGTSYRFEYLASALVDPTFRTLPGLSRIGEPNISEDLFPLFQERLMSSRRDDFSSTMTALGLPENATPMEVLARTGGHRAGDFIELIEVPTFDSDDGDISFTFFSHGVRYMTDEAQAAIAHLRPGHALSLRLDSANAVNPRALLMADGRLSMGYVPDPLVNFVHDVIARDHDLRVEQANGPEVAFHFRLRVRLTGQIDPAKPPFTGPQWAVARERVAARRDFSQALG